MASASPKSHKRLGDFLNEEQEPFILHLYLLQRPYSKRWNNTSNSNITTDSGKSCLDRSSATTTCSSSSAFHKINRNPLTFPFSKVLTSLHKKLSFRTKKSTTHDSNTIERFSSATTHDSNTIERFSSASNSTVFHSCSDMDIDIDIDDHRNSSPSQKDKPLCSVSVQSQQATNKGKHRQSWIEERGSSAIPQSQNNEMLNQQRRRSCGVLVPKKITEDSLLSAALWSLVIESAKKESYKYTMELREILGPKVSQILKSKGALHKTKQVLFDCVCVGEMTATLPRKDEDDKKQFMGAEELGRIICERTKEWGHHFGDETNLRYLLALDYLNSLSEWSKFEQHVQDIGAEIADAILEGVKDEIVSDIIEILPPTTV